MHCTGLYYNCKQQPKVFDCTKNQHKTINKMKNTTNLSLIELNRINGGEEKKVLMGYPGASLVNLIWSALEGAYQKGYDDKKQTLEPCYDI
jgi:hypothetical protein